MHRLLGLAIAVLIFSTTAQSLGVAAASAMEFRFAYNPQEKIRVIVGEGEIVAGDAERLSTALEQADRDGFGNIPLYLHSPGGSVSAAMEVAEVIIENEFSVLVPSASACESACVILYLSGRFHQVLGNGVLGLHSCYYVRPDGTPQPDPLCNEVIAQFVFKQGTSVGAVIQHLNETPPGEMKYFDKGIACAYGLCGPPGFDDTPAIPSFECTGSLNAAELAICNDRRLARNEASLAKLYRETLSSGDAAKKSAIIQSQRNWIERRDRCNGSTLSSCILQSIRAQRDVLFSF